MHRRGSTFAELMVVIAILTMFALLATPRVLSGIFSSKLDVGLHAVRENLEFARSRTIASGLRHQFYLDAETREMLVQAFRPEETLSQNPTGLTDDFVLRDRLPREVTVQTWTVSPMAVPAAGSGAQLGTHMLTLYPEGRSDDAVVVLQSDDGERRGLLLNGFTGELREMTSEELAGRY
jgi:type II secretory pathway pseudopilin PulG